MNETKPAESYLSGIRKERCKWCAAGTRFAGCRETGTEHYVGDSLQYRPCTAPSAEALVEELAGKLAEADREQRPIVASFLAYLNAHPQQRFWQALRNWSGYGFILGTNDRNGGNIDTFRFPDEDFDAVRAQGKETADAAD